MEVFFFLEKKPYHSYGQ